MKKQNLLNLMGLTLLLTTFTMCTNPSVCDHR